MIACGVLAGALAPLAWRSRKPRLPVGDERHEYCYACYTGDYPIELVSIDQLVAAKRRRNC